MTEKTYSEETVTILRSIERLDAKYQEMSRKIDDMYCQMKSQWKQIDSNKSALAEINTKFKIIAAALGIAGPVCGGFIASYLTKLMT